MTSMSIYDGLVGYWRNGMTIFDSISTVYKSIEYTAVHIAILMILTAACDIYY